MLDWQRELFEESRVARLGTLARDGRPHLVPVCFAVLREAIAVAVDEKPKRSTRLARLANVERDPRVTLLVDRYDDDWERLAWVRVDGRGSVFERGGMWPEALAELRRRYSQYQAMALEELPMLRIEPERIAGWRWHEGIDGS